MELTKSVAIGIVVGVVAGSAWTAAQSAFPVRLEEPAAGSPAPATTLTLDDLVVTATSPVLGVTETVVPIDELEARCADDDGCELRMAQILAGAGVGAEDLDARLFSVSDGGTLWRLRFYDGTSDGSGSIADSTTELIMRLTGGSPNQCELIDGGSTNDYRVSSFNDIPTSPWTCVLRVAD